MSQTHHIMATLKGLLKSRDKTYKELALYLKLTERGVKKAFADNSFRLQRLEEICEFLGISLGDLIRLSERGWMEQSPMLTPDQEEVLSKNEHAFVVFHLLLAGLSPEEIDLKYRFGNDLMEDLIEILRDTDLLENSKVAKVKSNRTPAWIPGGLLETKYGGAISQDIILNPTGEGYMRFAHTRLSNSSVSMLQGKMKKFELELFACDTSQEGRSPETDSYGFFHVLKPWRFATVEKYRRDK